MLTNVKTVFEELFQDDLQKNLFDNMRTSRRILDECEVKITPSCFAQPIDLDFTLSGNQEKDMPHMPGYPYRSALNAIQYIHELREHGIHSVVIRPVGKKDARMTPSQILDDHVEGIRTIRDAFPLGEITLTVDPFSTALNTDGSWGVKNDHQEGLNYMKTAELISDIALQYSAIGVDEILTLGRIEGEVNITRSTLDHINSPMKIKSFSQNSETSTAYIYLSDSPQYVQTGQKVLIGNMTEMCIQTLIDIYEGTNIIIVKPIENLHLILMTSRFLKNKDYIIDFILDAKTSQIIEKNAKLRNYFSDILFNIDRFFEKCQAVKVGTYTVSGTYYLQKKLEIEKSEKFSFALGEELIKNALSAANPYLDRLIDRNSLWFVKQLARQGQ